MTFLFKNSKGKKKIKNQSSIEILDRLNGYLEKNTTKPVKFLMRFWKDQEDVLTYKEIRQAILDGYMSEEMFRLWRQDYSILVSEKMYPVWKNAMASGAVSQPIMDQFAGNFAFDLNTHSVLSWINERGAEFVTSVTTEQKNAIKALLTQHINGSYTLDELSQVIRPCVGLTEPQAKANLRYYNSVKAKLTEQHPRMKQESVQKKAKEAAMKYAERQHRQRAYTIAQTEMSFAYNRGADEGIRQAQGKNLLGVMEKRWSTSGDGNVCDICRAMDGIQIAMDDDFDFKGKLLFAGQKRTPPAHPRCACAIKYLEIVPPKISQITQEAEFIRISREDNVSVESIEQLEYELGLLPESHRSIIESAVTEVKLVTDSNSRYERKSGIVYLLDGLQEGEVIHELGHVLETQMDLYHNLEFIWILREGFEEFSFADIEYVPDEYGKTVFFAKNEKFISEYQGRLYDELDFYDEDGEINPFALGDYFAEGYREYILNSNNLREHDKRLYDFIKRLI